MPLHTYDVIVLGLGAMGSAALYQLAKRGVRVLGIDRFTPPHRFGSSHGDTRITRQAIGEGDEYVPLVLRSHEIWRELEAATGRSLLSETGGLILSSNPDARHHGAPFFEKTVGAAQRFGIEHALLTPADVRRRFPQFDVSNDTRAYFEPGAGFVRPELCVEAQLDVAKTLSAEVHVGETVLEYNAGTTSVTVRTDRGTYEAGQLVVTAGPWLPALLGEPYRDLFRVYRQVLYWFDADLTRFAEDSPIFIWELGANPDDLIYGFPPVDGPTGGFKVAADDFSRPLNPSESALEPASAAEGAAMYGRYVAPNISGARPAVLRSEPCMYTLTPDYRFVIDDVPGQPNVLFASACSGHGFKHSAAIGETLAEIATVGSSAIDISAFRLSRLMPGLNSMSGP
ncbi:MAG: N-methyl-L-tryptophan oxidase [Dehalococcoidia bacterium]